MIFKIEQFILIRISNDMRLKLSCLEEILDRILIIEKQSNFKQDEL